MPYQPSLSQVHVDGPLTNFSIAYMQDQTNFVADRVFPNIPCDHKSDVYYQWNKDAFLRAGGVQTPFGVESPGGGMGLSTKNYDVGSPWRWHFDLLPDVVANADAGVNIDQAAANFVMNGLLVQREVNWVTNYFGTGIWGTDVTGSTNFARWDDDANSDPITDVSKARTTIKGNTGYYPNTMVVSDLVNEALLKHPLVLDRFKYTSSASITEDMLARLFRVDRYLVASAVQATSQENETVTTAYVLGKHALLCYSAPAPSLLAHSAGYNFVWSKLTGLNNLGVATYRVPMPWLGVSPGTGRSVERIEAQTSYVMKVTGSDLGYFFSGAVS